MNYLIVRPFNAVGSGELPEITGEEQAEFGIAHVIPDFVYKALIKQAPFEIFGDGEQVRTFTHSRDINTHDISSIARRIWDRGNPNLNFPGFKHLPTPAADVKFRIGVADKAREVLGWTPRYELDYIIEDTLSFVKQRIEAPK